VLFEDFGFGCNVVGKDFWLNVYLWVGLEIIWCVPHGLVVRHLQCIVGSKWLHILIKIRLVGLRILWITWSILSLCICIEFV